MTLAQAHAVELRPRPGVAVAALTLLDASQSGLAQHGGLETATSPVRRMNFISEFTLVLFFKFVLGMPLWAKKASTQRSLVCFLSGHFEHKKNKVCGNPGILA